MTSRIGSMLVLAGALAAVGCKSGSSLSLNAATGAEDDAGVPDAGDAGATADAGSGGIDLCGQLHVQRTRLVVRRIDLERSAPAADAGDAGTLVCDCPDGGTVCVKGDDVHVGPFLVDLSGDDLTGGIHQVFDVEVPSGTYDRVRFVISQVSRHQAQGDGGLAGMKDLHASIVADGTFGGAAFQFRTPIHLKQKQQGPFTVADGTNSIVLNVDAARWFVGADGQVLDPRDPRNRGRILGNIRCSVRMASHAAADGGAQVRKEFDDDDDEDRCRADDDDDGDDDGHHGHHEEAGDHGAGGGDGDHDGDDDHHRHACFPAPVLDCGAAAEDAGTPDAGPDAG